MQIHIDCRFPLEFSSNATGITPSRIARLFLNRLVASTYMERPQILGTPFILSQILLVLKLNTIAPQPRLPKKSGKVGAKGDSPSSQFESTLQTGE